MTAFDDLLRDLLAAAPGLEGVLREHRAHGDGPLPHAFVADVARWAVAAGPTREVRAALAVLERHLAAGDDDVQDVIAPSFVSGLRGEDPAPIEALGPRLAAGWRALNAEATADGAPPAGLPALPVIVRRAAAFDAQEIAGCLAALGYDTPAPLVAEKLAELDGSAADAVFVAQATPAGPLWGVASVHVLPLFHAPGRLARITALAVRAGVRRRGVGRALVAAAEAWGWSAGARRVEVTSGDHRPGAHAFYAALGYAEDERRFVKHAPGATPPAPVRAGRAPG